jgi:hypothetical protein
MCKDSPYLFFGSYNSIVLEKFTRSEMLYVECVADKRWFVVLMSGGEMKLSYSKVRIE